MGVVYKAQDLKLERFVALKFLPHHLGQDDQEKKRFIHEAKAASGLDHPNICTIYEIDETTEGQAEDGRMFIAMAYYEGETLKKKIERGPLPLDEAINLAIQVAQGLQCAHEAGITHRDVKPANIMITNRGEVKIVDFGLAKLAGRTKLTKDGMTLGTVAYMSPEQARGEEVDHRTDIWSLGVVLYEMICGRMPFRGEYEAALMYSLMNEEPEPITGLRTGVPMALERIVDKSLAKSLGERYQHVDEMLVDLKSVGKNLESGVTKKPLAKTKLPRRSAKILYGAIVFFVVLIIGGGIYFQYRGEKDSPEGSGQDQRTADGSSSQWQNSIAVLPFKNISPDPEQEYFCDGMTEQLITNLSQLQALKVIARTSVMKFKDSERTIPEIAEELHVAHIIEGSIRKHGNQIRVTAQLIQADEGHHL
jgi:serine/threonine protein kinase